MIEIVRTLAAKAERRPRLTRAHAADILYVLIGPDVYRTIVLERRWTRRQWADFVERAILSEIFNTPLERPRSNRRLFRRCYETGTPGCAVTSMTCATRSRLTRLWLRCEAVRGVRRPEFVRPSARSGPASSRGHR